MDISFDRFFHRLTLRRQIFAALVAVSVITSAILGTIVYRFSKVTIEREYQTAHKNALQVASNIIGINLDRDIALSRLFLMDSDLMGPLQAGQEGSRYFTAGENLRIQAVLQNTLNANNSIADILVVNMKGNICFTSQNDYNRSYIQHYFQNGILNESWIAKADEAKGKEIFFGDNVLFDNGKKDTFSLVKKLINPANLREAGYMVINIRKSSFQSAFGKGGEDYRTSDYLILEKEDSGEGSGYKVVYSDIDLPENEETQIKDAYKDREEKRGYLFTAYTNSVSGWDIVNVISEKELARRSRYVQYVAMIVALSLMAVSVWLSGIIARRITLPLRKMEDVIRTVGEGNYRVEEEFDDSEVGRIGNQFKNMVNHNLDLNKKLMEADLKEREAELLLLQTQINPHYLYNTLDALYMMAIIRNEDEIADFVQALSENFRLSLNKGKKLIPVSDEMERIRAYMKIQNYRFNNRYSLKIEIGEEIQREKILTFILQPLVENAVYHGLEPKPGEGAIFITARKEEGDRLIFTVEDDGVGIADMELLDSGYGVRNIKERIRLFYGEEYGIRFENREEGGTRVVICIPHLQESDPEIEGEEKLFHV